MRKTVRYLTAALAIAACYRSPATSDTASTRPAEPGGTSADSSAASVPSRADAMPVQGSVTVRTDRQTYRAGDPITLTIASTSSSTYAFNPCTRILEREIDTGWAEVREQRMCTMIAYILDPRATRTEQTELGADIPAGRYHVVLALTEEPPSGRARSVRAVSRPITVTR